MRKTQLVPALCLAALLALSAAALPASASHDDWFVLGGAFRAGNFSFSILVGDPGTGYPYGYYYRTPQRLAYRGYHCTSSCLLRDGYAYHHDSCPLLTHHLGVHHFDPFDLHFQFAPPHPVWFEHRFDRRLPHHWHDRHDRHDRYDRHDRHDRYDRYDRHDRHDRHDRYDRDNGRRDRDRYDRDRYDRDRYDRDRHRGDRDRHDRGRRDRDRDRHRDRRPRPRHPG